MTWDTKGLLLCARELAKAAAEAMPYASCAFFKIYSSMGHNNVVVWDETSPQFLKNFFLETIFLKFVSYLLP